MCLLRLVGDLGGTDFVLENASSTTLLCAKKSGAFLVWFPRKVESQEIRLEDATSKSTALATAGGGWLGETAC